MTPAWKARIAALPAAILLAASHASAQFDPSTLAANYFSAASDPRVVVEGFKSFLAAVRAELPAVRVVYVSIKPGPQKLAFWSVIQKANHAIKALCEADPALRFVDLSPVLMTEGGELRRDLYLPDGHLNAAGYAKVLPLIRPVVESAWALAGGPAPHVEPTPP